MDIATTSTEYVHVPVTAVSGGNPVTLTDPPQLAFMATEANPAEADWLDAEWVSGNARILVGPAGGAVTLAAGTYWLWVTWTGGSETPVYRAGRVRVY